MGLTDSNELSPVDEEVSHSSVNDLEGLASANSLSVYAGLNRDKTRKSKLLKKSSSVEANSKLTIGLPPTLKGKLGD